MCNHSVGDAALGLQWHVIGMYAPSFFTGTLIMRFGVRTVMATGLLLIAGAASIGLLGLALWNFWVALALLGVGWNLSFIGATTLITECHGRASATRSRRSTIFWCSARWRSDRSCRACC